ncbi:MAG: aldehyde dehydrogenase, partial [Rhodospirillales bacterium]|nr:aldehyde dehydrogenase [Rhodospirillales bacterium]
MTQLQDNKVIENVVHEVLRRLQSESGSGSPSTVAIHSGGNGDGHTDRPTDPSVGRFSNVDEAVATAERAQRQLVTAGLATRDAICKLLKEIAKANAKSWGEFELNETKVGRLDHKIAKLEVLEGVPGVEFLETVAHSGDDGVGLDEGAPWGVIGAITPVTHSIPTMTANAINMIAAGNAMVVNAHPSGAKSAALAAEMYNRAIRERFNIDPLICVIDPPTLRSAEEIFRHERIPLLVATGGPAVARAAMKQPKRAIVAGPGNPPVVVDETADLDNAARSIIAGGGFDNNLLCIGEKEVFVVDSIFDRMMAAMEQAGAYRLYTGQIQKLTEKAFNWHKDHFAVSKELVGKDVAVLAAAAGATNVPANCDLLFGETDEGSPFVNEEQMMPFVPFVRVKDFDEALQMALKYEHGFGHTAIIHSNNLARITQMGRAMNVTLFVANGPSTASLGTG